MMTAVDFLKTVGRMCRSYESCLDGCPMHSENCDLMATPIDKTEEIVQIVEQWGKDHPIKTRQSELLKIFPNARKGEDDIMLHCPQTFDPNVKCNTSSFFPHAEGCSYCRKKYWLEEVE